MASNQGSFTKMSEELFDFECTDCKRNEKSTKAVKYCHDCEGYCCQSCTDIHSRLKILESHVLVDITLASQQSTQQATKLQYPTERCSVHEGKLIDTYCKRHNNVGCYMCVLKHHRSCPEDDIHSIPEMIDTLFKFNDRTLVQKLLRDRIQKLQTHRKTKTSQLNMLLESKKCALQEVMSFRKVLLACIDTIVDKSKEEIEGSYEQFRQEMEMDEDKRSIDVAYDDLKKTDDKLKVSDKNKAQEFVCTKVAEGALRRADKVIETKLNDKSREVLFVPNFAIVRYLESRVNLGDVQKGRHLDTSHKMYKIQNTKDICIHVDTDSSHNLCNGCCITEEGHLLVTDYFNKKVKLVDLTQDTVIDSCLLDANPYAVCCLGNQEIAVSCQGENKIQFLSVENRKMTTTRQMKISHLCPGIAFMNDRLYMTDAKETLRVYDMEGTLVKEAFHDKDGQKLFTCCRRLVFNKSGENIFVADDKNGLVCLDQDLNYLYTINDTDLAGTTGVCTDGSGNLFVTGGSSNSIVQFREYGRKVGVLMRESNGLKSPMSICFHPDTNSCIVVMNSGNVLTQCRFRKNQN